VIALSSSRMPTAADMGAITKTDADNHYVHQGSSGVIYQDSDLAWDSPTGAYLKDNGTHSSLIWHMGLNTGSVSAAQFYFDFANGGIKYRSSRDNSGFEKPWARIYTDQDKPTVAEIGALSINELVGIPMPWPQATAPSGWLKCNGQTFDKNIYPLLGQTYPSGILPDLRGEFIRGYDDGRSIDPGRQLLSPQGFTVQGHTHPSGSYNRGSGTLLYTSVGMQAGGDRVFSETRENENAGTETRPRNIAFNYIVRAA
ncbi:phage tail protein, partial [Pectobacterium brasiliense]